MSWPCVALDGGNDVFEPDFGVHSDAFSNKLVNLLPLETFHFGMHVLIQSCDTLFAVLFDLGFQVCLGGRHSLPIDNCPGLFLSHMLDRLLGEDIADIADWRFVIAWERARIRHVAVARRLDDLNGRLVHIVFEMMTVGIKVDMTKVID